jgi:hypothetical protein
MTKRHSSVDATLPKVASVRGQLASASPIEFSQFLLLGRKTGALHLAKAGQRGVLYFHLGNIVSAIGPDLRGGEDAAMRLLAWDEGEFSFVEEPVGPAREIELGTQNLLLETARLLDETGAEAEVVAESLRQVDELSRTFAAITAGSSAGAGSGNAALTWLLELPGRSLYAIDGRAVHGQSVGGEIVAFEPGVTFDPADLGAERVDGEFDGWIERGGRRLYLSTGADGYRLLHPHAAPSAGEHIEAPATIDRVLGTVSPSLIYGPAGAGKSLLAAAVARLHADRGWRVLVVTGLPSHDLGDGVRILHATIPPVSSLERARRMLQRWRPDLVVVDIDPSEGVIGFVRDCRMAGVRLAVTLRTAERAAARESIRLLTGDKSGWQLLSPWPVAPGPKLDISLEAA